MTEGNGNQNFSNRFADLQRYVPLLVWVIVVATVLFIPLRIIQYGYLPGDDALRHAAKAVSGKQWSEILVLNPVYKIDHEFGWNLFLEKIYRWTNWDTDKLVVFSVVLLFVLVGCSALPWLRRPEAWLIALLTAHLASGLESRLMLGRPFLISFASVATILLMWQKFGAAPPKKWMLALATIIFALCTYVHGAWYLWILLLVSFVFAQQFRWAISLGICWVVGVFLGSALTGHPIGYPAQAVKLMLLALGMHQTQRTMATELQPSQGDVLPLIAFGALIAVRQLAKLNSIPLLKNPAFWLAFLCWVLGFKVARFWNDWGWPALLVLIAWDAQLFLESRFAENCFKRIALAAAIAVTLVFGVTADADGRWTYTLFKDYLDEKNPDLKGWMPDKGGIFYTADMTLFYDTFFKNPHGDWRYMLGFEPTWMPEKDFEVFYSIIWNGNSARAYTPWVKQIKPADRLAVTGNRGNIPPVPQLEWNYAVSGIWIGRLPRTNAPPPAPTIPATASLDSLTNTPSVFSSQ